MSGRLLFRIRTDRALDAGQRRPRRRHGLSTLFPAHLRNQHFIIGCTKTDNVALSLNQPIIA